MFEHYHQPLAPRTVFISRLKRSLGMAIVVLGISLGIGVVGYHFAAGLAWIDALVNASMILAGMGPVDPVPSTLGKLFASFYALFSGVVFLGSVSVMLAPVAHRLLHRFHLADDETPEPPKRGNRRK